MSSQARNVRCELLRPLRIRRLNQQRVQAKARGYETTRSGRSKWIFAGPDGARGTSIGSYTPEFNDGEPCEFNAYILDVVGEDAEGYMYGIPSELADAFVEWSSQYEWDEYSRLFSPLNISAHPIQNVLESMFGYYGFVVIYYLEDGELKFVDGEYDCGY